MTGGGNGDGRDSRVLDALNEKYCCLYEPLPPGGGRTNDNERRYFTSLRVYGKRDDGDDDDDDDDDDEDDDDDDDDDEPLANYSKTIKEKIVAALSDLRFREPHVLVQFWSPDTLWKRCLLTTLNQPFGIGAVDEVLYSYRLESEWRMYDVDGEQTENLGPPGRVYRQKFPEWCLDVNRFSPRQNVKDWATSCNIHGYINLPVFEPDSGVCVGVLELVTSSRYVDYAFEVQEVSRALKEVNLKSPIVFEDPSFYAQIQIADGRRQHELNKIFCFLKAVCDIQNIPLAQTWALSGYSSVVSNSGKLEWSCSSYNSKCIDKVCMSTYDLPHYVRDLSMWGYHEACKETHLEKSRGIVGRSLSSRGTYFCRDVTELDKDEYPLVHHARLSGITSCLAVYMKSIERDVEYVIEFVLPPHSANGAGLQRLVKTLKLQVENASLVQLGNLSSFRVIGELPFSWLLESPPETRNQRQLFENERKTEHVASFKNQIHVHYVEHVGDNMKNEPANSTSAGTAQSAVDIIKGKKRRNNKDKSSNSIKKRKRTDQSIGLEKNRKRYRKTNDKRADIFPVSISGTHDLATNVFHQPDQTNMLNGHAQPEVTIREQFIESTVERLTVKATYEDNMVKFPLSLSDGLLKLKELVAERFPLECFKLKYKDEVGDMIWITCDRSLMETIAEFRQPDGRTVIYLFVLPDA